MNEANDPTEWSQTWGSRSDMQESQSIDSEMEGTGQMRSPYRKRRNQLLDSAPININYGQRASDSEHPRPGILYEIDYKSLPLMAPEQLSCLRVALVSATTKLHVTMQFPSPLSLRTFFRRNADRLSSPGNIFYNEADNRPNLDEKFVISSRIAERILIRPISSDELLEQGHLKTFWLAEIDRGCSSPQENNAGQGPIRWGIRKKVCFRNQGSSSESNKENLQLTISKSRDCATKACILRAQNARMDSPVSALKVPKDMQGRWSSERYKAAQQKLIDILHEKGATPGNPILRHILRDEARKRIGDTGLLDHLLKHMADKVVTTGERYRRRHNSEGAMEYWLEEASLMDIRKSAGIEDPLWVPPPGWKPGDKLPERGYFCQGISPSDLAEIKQLKQEVEYLKSEVHLLSQRGAVPCEADILPERTHLAWQTNCMSEDTIRNQVENLKSKIEELQAAYVQLQEKIAVLLKDTRFESTNTNSGVQVENINKEGFHGNVMERLDKLEREVHKIFEEGKARYETLAVERLTLETQFANIWKVVMTMQEKISFMDPSPLLENAAAHFYSNPIMHSFVASTSQTVENQQLATQADGKGFKLCRPPGTFLWPSMVSQRPESGAPFRIEDVFASRSSESEGVTVQDVSPSENSRGKQALDIGDTQQLFLTAAFKALQDGLIKSGEGKPTPWLGLATPPLEN